MSNQLTNQILSDYLGEPITHDEALLRIKKNMFGEALYKSLPASAQQDIIAFVKGERSLPMYLDPFFDYCINGKGNRASTALFISYILGQNVKIVTNLPTVQNIVDRINYYSANYEVEFQDGHKADVEIQKFIETPSHKMIECLAANNIIKQYNRLKQLKGIHFRFDSLRPSYLIILTESSRLADPKYSHNGHDAEYIQFETNFIDHKNKVPQLSNIIIVSTADYMHNQSNRNTERDAWMAFLTSSDASTVLQLSTLFPHFADIYKKASILRNDTYKLITMYTEGLRLRDYNITISSSIKNNTESENLRLRNKLLEDSNLTKDKEINRLNRILHKRITSKHTKQA